MTNVVALAPPVAPTEPKKVDWNVEFRNFIMDVNRDLHYFPDLAPIASWRFPDDMTPAEWFQRTVRDAHLMDDHSRLSDALFPIRHLFRIDRQTGGEAFYLDSTNYWRSTSAAELKDFCSRWLSTIGAFAFAIDSTPISRTQLHLKVRDAMDHLKAAAGLQNGWASARQKRDRRPVPFGAFACGTLVYHDGNRTEAAAEPEDFILATDVIPAEYDPNAAVPPTFERFMQLMFSTRAERQTNPDTFLNRLWLAAFPALGLQPPDPTLMIIKGPGRDGKTLFWQNMLPKLVGETGFNLMGANTLQTFGSERTSSGGYDVGSFEDRRVVVADDSQSASINESVLKQLLAGSTSPQSVKARAIYGKPRTVQVTWSLVMLTNTDPRVTLADNGLDRRLAMWEIEGLQKDKLNAILADPAARAEAQEYSSGYLASLPEGTSTAWTEDPAQLVGIWNFFADYIAGFDREMMIEPNRIARDRLGTNQLDKYAAMMFSPGQYGHKKYTSTARARNIVKGALKLAFGGPKGGFSDAYADQQLERLGIPVVLKVQNDGRKMDLLARHLDGPLADLFVRYADDDRTKPELNRAIENFGVDPDHRAAFDMLISCHRKPTVSDVIDELDAFTIRNPNAMRITQNDVASLIRIEKVNPKMGAQFTDSRLLDDASAPSIELLKFVRDELRKAHAMKYKNLRRDKRTNDDPIAQQTKALDNLIEAA